ncbi:uncharacterized protein DSM5745_08203 [Aspergillus mulundensis]|uniref:Nucleolar protein Dnt1-like N-terminal domain-containing protein n=1 Tax=Aspergillus mulundensis TaxID=1810919 RepID=A0A3D8R9G4_9EURO|nr:hypothetical protein DSM5745_08203 [Aspergillus mulundensis]RDW70692.1 hypothetical protein DSM5745_08203 [Aspergillus mulundensis]
MVFLRLTVKVFPPDQAQPSNSFSFRSLLGDRERDDASRTSSGSTAGKPASFLIVLETPEDVTLGGLAGMIREKWRKLRPGVAPLAIKKLLDDDHEADDLDTDMTVADVFVDKGKARSDGHDQRRTVRVIQKPIGGRESPVRYPSVAQDWDAAAEHYEIQRQKKQRQEAERAVNKLGAITEESGRGFESASPVDANGWADYTPNRTHRRDIPVSSVEKDLEIPVSPSQRSQPVPKSPTPQTTQDLGAEDSSAPQGHRVGSEELGDSPRSSRATTPRKKSTPRRDSIHSQGSANRSGAGGSITADSPALQLAREHTNSVSPQKRPAPEVTNPDPTVLDEETENPSESESDDEGNKDEEARDKDGDTAMREPTPKRKSESPVATKKPAEVHAADLGAAGGVQSRKRKNSTDELPPSKEPRLRGTTPPPTVNGKRRNSEVSPGTPRFSPSGRRLGGTTSFTGVARRLSFADRTSETPVQGLGLGITGSPTRKPPAAVDLSQDSTKSAETIPQSTPKPISALTARRGSLSKDVSTPTTLQTPADKVKNLHSALRKDVLTNSARRSVSFAEDDDALVSNSQPVPTSTPMGATNPPTITPASQTPSSEKRRSSGSMVFPPGYSMELIAQYEREAEAKLELQKKERAEFEEKIKAAEKDNSNPEYLNILKLTFKTWQKSVDGASSIRKAAIKPLEGLQAQLKKMEESMNKQSSQGKGKKSQASKPAMSQQALKNDTPTSKDAAKETKKPPVSNASGWNAVNAKAHSTNAKSATPIANGTSPKPPSKGPPKEPTARTVATRTLSKPSKPTPLQSQNSTSDEHELPAMKVQARATANANKQSTPKEPIEVSSSSESEDSSEDEDSADETSSEGSSSESDSESASEIETRNKKSSSPVKSSAPKASQQSNAASPPSAQRLRPAVLSSQQASQSQSQPQSQSDYWSIPKPSQPSSSQPSSSRPSLKGLLKAASQAQEVAAAKSGPVKRGANSHPRRGVFSPPDSDSEETESESESESEEESDSDCDSDKESDKENWKEDNAKDRSPSPASVMDAGDIMSSGKVQKLRTARVGSRN